MSVQDEDKIKVLVVDDEESFARTLSERIRMRELSANAVFSGNEAIGSIEKVKPDVMVLDLKMPGMGGMDVLKKVKADHPDMQVIILTGHGTDQDRDEAYQLGASDYLEKPVELSTLVARIKGCIKPAASPHTLYSYGDFIPAFQRLLAQEGVSFKDNALGIKCFCRDDNQDQIGYFLMQAGMGAGWFDLNSFGAYPAGRSIESLWPPSHHVPEKKEKPWLIVFHATHVGCDSEYTLGVTERFGIKEPSPSCGLLAGILARHRKRKAGDEPARLNDFEMRETENVLLPYLDEIEESPYPMAATAEKLLELGHSVFDRLIGERNGRAIYVGGLNVDYDPTHPGNNFFVPKYLYAYDGQARRMLTL
jgi:CheY-like chemotaxis protein